MWNRRGDEDGSAAGNVRQVCSSCFGTCGTGKRGRQSPTQDRRPDEAGLLASLDRCGRPGAEPAAWAAVGQPRVKNQRHQKEFLQVSNDENTTTEQPRAQAMAMRAGGKKKAAPKKKAGRKAAPKKAAARKTVGRKKAAGRKAAPKKAARKVAKKAGAKKAGAKKAAGRKKAAPKKKAARKAGGRKKAAAAAAPAAESMPNGPESMN
jgi:hypothetical protein